jgi:hypothetical protein
VRSKAKAQTMKKLKKVRARRYIAPGFVISLTAFFAVPKGDDDIRMVYDASVLGLNGAMRVPQFTLPTIDTHIRSVEECTFMADVDVGERSPFMRNSGNCAGWILLCMLTV